jgi:hypothetical protein
MNVFMTAQYNQHQSKIDKQLTDSTEGCCKRQSMPSGAAPSERQMCEESMCSKEHAGELIKRLFMEISCSLLSAFCNGTPEGLLI